MENEKILHTKKLPPKYSAEVKHILVQKFKGRGTDQNPANRFDMIEYIPEVEENIEEKKRPETKYFKDTSRTIVTFNDSPDIYGGASMNAYKGCEHGCVYCYARPTHEYLSLSAGVDFETKIFVKHDAPKLLYKTLTSKKWNPQTTMMSGNTDCYQPVEKKLKLTRGCLEVFHQFHNPVSIVTKNKLVTRDIDILTKMAEYKTVSVFISITSLDNRLASVMEPQTTKPHLKLEAIKELSSAGIPTGVLVAPVIPGLTEHEMPEILKQAAEAGAKHAGFVMLRLPHGVKDLFLNWLETYFPDRKQKVVNMLKELHGGKLYDSTFYVRGRGNGAYAEEVKNIFKISCRKFGINLEHLELTTEHFRNPEKVQLDLFER